jgi:uncharacterized protein
LGGHRLRWQPDNPRRIAHALVLVASRSALLFVGGLGLLGPALLGDHLFTSGWKSYALLAGVLGVLDVGLILNLGLLRYGGVGLRELGWRFDRPGRDVGLGVAGFCVCSAPLLAAYVASGEMTLPQIWAFTVEMPLTERGVYLLIAVFGAALVEETLFRGYLQPALAARLGLVGGIVLQAAIFSLMHMNFRPVALVVKFLFGCVFGALRGRDRSLLVPGVAHGLIWAVWGA